MIVDEIKGLDHEEQAQMLGFVRTLDAQRQWSGQELTEGARALVAETNAVEAAALWERIAAGFYGHASNA